MTYKEEILREFEEWVKTQPIYVGGGLTDREVLVIRDGKFESAIEVYLKEKFIDNGETDCLDEDAKQASIPYTPRQYTQCAVCGFWRDAAGSDLCPNCGADMRKGEKE